MRLVTRCTYRFSLGCTLKSDKREFKVDVDDDDTEQQLSLKTVRNTLSIDFPSHVQHLFQPKKWDRNQCFSRKPQGLDMYSCGLGAALMNLCVIVTHLSVSVVL